MQELYDEGCYLREIAVRTGFAKETVRRYVVQRKDRSRTRLETDKSWVPLPTRAEDVVLRDVPEDKARFRIQIEQNGKKMGEWLTETYPDWRQMYERCLVYNVENAMDFRDREDCMQPFIKQVHGIVIGQNGGTSAYYTIDFLTDDPVSIEELFL